MEDITVIYNDTCPICAREVAGYKRAARRDALPVAFRGLSEGDLARYGLTTRDAARRFHVMEDGRLVDGIDAFALLWDRIPRLRWLARLVRLPVVAPVARVLYDHAAAPALYALHRRRVRRGAARRIA
ncbi:thiol-disulfide oxidoreductase DCC family protein [Citreimonas sp.]|uniref:thiol-disulfide oxidoreductase DCC family protein n=1 Tax=Citreimonas sp. TaxID=3036715 RepID=UPI0035C794A0